MEWRVAGEYAAHPKTDKAVSVSFLAAEDGTPLICAHTTSTALEAGRCCDYLDALAVLKFNGDKEATRAYLADKGYGRFQFKYYCAADLNADDWKLEYLIQDVLVAKQPCIIGGPGKGMKTSLASGMVVSLAAGMPFFDRFAVTRPCRVLFLSGESGMATLIDTVDRVCASKGILRTNLKNLFISEFVPRFDNDRHLDGVAHAF